MNANTFKRMIDAIAQFTTGINMWDVREYKKISVSNTERPELMKVLFDGYVLPLEDSDNAIIIKLSSENDIMIYKTVVENGVCYGYDYCTYVETKGRTQIEIVAELMFTLQHFVNSIIESEVK